MGVNFSFHKLHPLTRAEVFEWAVQVYSSVHQTNLVICALEGINFRLAIFRL